MMDNRLGYIHFWLSFVGIYMVFFPMHYIGIAGFPRRYYSFTNFDAFSTLYGFEFIYKYCSYTNICGAVYFPLQLFLQHVQR
jgi:cytochrome c oxidase subunit 1